MAPDQIDRSQGKRACEEIESMRRIEQIGEHSLIPPSKEVVDLLLGDGPRDVLKPINNVVVI